MTPDPRFGDARIRPAPFLIVVGGSVALIVGVLAVIGWWTPAPMVVQFRANVVFNEALAIAAAGAATLMLVLGRPAVARVLGAGICVGALLTLLQPLLGVSLGIDDLLWQPAAADAETRMAPSSAFVLMLAGLCVALPPRLVSARVVVSLGVLAGAGIALTGAVAGIPQAAAWGASRSMSRVAGCALLAVGVALATHAFTRAQGRARPAPPLGAAHRRARVGRRGGALLAGARRAPGREHAPDRGGRAWRASARARRSASPAWPAPCRASATRPTRSRRRSTSGGRRRGRS